VEASFNRIRCGNIATLSTDRVVVGRPHPAFFGSDIPSKYGCKSLTINELIVILRSNGGVAGGLLSSGRLSQRSSERS
jgi:hypothetical protein